MSRPVRWMVVGKLPDGRVVRFRGEEDTPEDAWAKVYETVALKIKDHANLRAVALARVPKSERMSKEEEADEAGKRGF